MWNSLKRSSTVVLSILGVLVIAGFGGTRMLSEPPSPQALGLADIERFRQLVQRYQSVYAHASVTRDVSTYPSVFYNDPEFDLSEYTPGCFPLIDDERSETDAILDQLDARPQGNDIGLLSCMIAEMVGYHRNVTSWEAEVARAAAEGRSPSPASLDEGGVPMERAVQADAEQTARWDGPRYVLEAVYLDDAHVRFAYAEAPLEQTPEVIYHLLFTNVNGEWLISAIWTSFPGFEE